MIEYNGTRLNNVYNIIKLKFLTCEIIKLNTKKAITFTIYRHSQYGIG